MLPVGDAIGSLQPTNITYDSHHLRLGHLRLGRHVSKLPMMLSDATPGRGMEGTVLQ